jgi:1-acyl-sn-glycerol-3-phosphate acyltransferase
MAESSQSLALLGRDGLPGVEPDRTVTDWGRSERLGALADATVLGFLYHYWFRVEADGLAHLPATGGALLVANRAGPLPADGAMIARAVREQHERRRQVHLASSRSFADVPGLGMTLTKLGVVFSHPANLHRLLFDEGELVLVFPEGAEAARKPLRWRYRLRRFDSVPFVATALRARVPIIPVAVLGGEEALPSLGSIAAPGRRLALPLSLPLPLPAKFRLRFLEPIGATELEAAAEHDRAFTDRLAEQIRCVLQENLLEMVAQRRSVWLG